MKKYRGIEEVIDGISEKLL